MPLDITGKHAEEDVRSYVIFGPVPYGTDKKLDAFEGPEDPLHLREVLVAPHRNRS